PDGRPDVVGLSWIGETTEAFAAPRRPRRGVHRSRLSWDDQPLALLRLFGAAILIEPNNDTELFGSQQTIEPNKIQAHRMSFSPMSPSAWPWSTRNLMNRLPLRWRRKHADRR